jgi:hypothetical protein
MQLLYQFNTINLEVSGGVIERVQSNSLVGSYKRNRSDKSITVQMAKSAKVQKVRLR